MPLDENRFPALIRELYELVSRLEAMFPGRPFTPDGHMVGSLAECYAEYYYDLSLYRCSHPGHDGELNGQRVEVKATQKQRIALRSGPECLLVFRIFPDGTFEEIYNGPGKPVWELFADKTRPSNGQFSISLARLRTLMQHVPLEDRILRVRG